MSEHRAPGRPRWGRIVALCSSAGVTTVAVLGGLGLIASETAPSPAAASDTVGLVSALKPTLPPVPVSPSAPPPTDATPSTSDSAPTPVPTPGDGPASTSLPADSGEGRRAVFSQSRQRVWLVSADERVLSTYLVSGSVEDNLEPGTYEVWSRSRWAVGIDDSGVMEHFVRFTRGPSGAAIGFHSIPTKQGTPLQSVDDLGTPQSHGCIRQRAQDAERMWRFAQMGDTVVVTA